MALLNPRLLTASVVLLALTCCVSLSEGRQFYEYFHVGHDYCYLYEAPEGPHTVSAAFEMFDGWSGGSMMALVRYQDAIYQPQQTFFAQRDQISFTTHRGGRFDICFNYVGPTNVKTVVFIKSTIDQDTEPELEVTDGEYVTTYNAVKDIMSKVSELQDHFTIRSVEFEHTTSNTYGRVVLLTVLNGAVLVGATLWQMFHIKSFLKAKKVV